MPARRQRAGGYTLIELVVVIAIVGVAVTLVGIAIGNIRRADLKATVGKVSASMRYLHNLAIINNTPYRLVIDMDEGKFWGEKLQSDDPCARFLPDRSTKEGEEDDEGGSGGYDRDNPYGAPKAVEQPKDELAERAAEAKARAEPADPSDRAPYARTKNNLLSERELPAQIVVSRVLTTHHREPQRQGQVAIHFFPGGYAEDAYVWFGYGGDAPDAEAKELRTLELSGLMGRVTNHTKVLDRTSFGQEDEES